MKLMLSILIVLFIGVSVIAAEAPTTTTKPARDFSRWEKEISAIEARDKKNPPPKGANIFTGSSTIARWKTLVADFEGTPVVNHGFGGSEIADATYFADRIIFPYEPKRVFLRAGGNDIHSGKSPEKVFANYKAFAEKVHGKLPETEIIWISQCPAPSRWEERDKNKALNDMVKAYVETNPKLKYLETYDMTLTPDGKAREELFVADRLHFNEAGYKLLTERVKPFLKD